MMTVRKLRVDGGEVAVVEVRPSATPPVRFKGRVYIRVGPRRAIASLNEERRLNERRRSLDLPFDSRPIPGSSLADLDTYAFTAVLLPALLPPDVLADNERSIEQRLAALRLTSRDSRVCAISGPRFVGGGAVGSECSMRWAKRAARFPLETWRPSGTSCSARECG